MRPTHGERLTADNAVAFVRAAEAGGWLVQPKLGGDRVLLRVAAGGVEVFNRFGTPYGFKCNADDWAGAPLGTILDAEAYAGHAYAFECLQLGNEGLAGHCVSVRAAVARDLTATLGRLPWLWDIPGDDWLREASAHLPRWEGVVLKLRGQPYRPLTKPHRESWDWLKLKWRASILETETRPAHNAGQTISGSSATALRRAGRGYSPARPAANAGNRRHETATTETDRSPN